MNKRIITWLDHIFYPKIKRNWDDKLMRKEILKISNKENRLVLDVGAGAGILEEMNFKGVFKEVVGIDSDVRVKTNPYLDKSYLGLSYSMPFLKNESFDLIISNNVFEHIDKPEEFFNELSRILKKGGILIAKTPNRYHYMPIIASITPLSFHNYYNKLRGRKHEDTFKTRYLLNSYNDQSKYATKANFEIDSIIFHEGRPEYLRTFFIFYLAGILYERLVNLFNIRKMKIVMITRFKKVMN